MKSFFGWLGKHRLIVVGIVAFGLWYYDHQIYQKVLVGFTEFVNDTFLGSEQIRDQLAKIKKQFK